MAGFTARHILQLRIGGSLGQDRLERPPSVVERVNAPCLIRNATAEDFLTGLFSKVGDESPEFRLQFPPVKSDSGDAQLGRDLFVRQPVFIDQPGRQFLPIA